MASIEFSPLPSFIEERDVLLSDWEYVHGLDIYLCTIFTQSCYSFSFIKERDVLSGIHHALCRFMGYGYLGYSSLHNHVFLCSRGSMIYYLKGILGTLICYTLGYSFPQTTFLSLLKVFGVLAVFNEAQVRGIVYINVSCFGVCLSPLLSA
jgi:hypothetical protein